MGDFMQTMYIATPISSTPCEGYKETHPPLLLPEQLKAKSCTLGKVVIGVKLSEVRLCGGEVIPGRSCNRVKLSEVNLCEGEVVL